MNFHLQKSCTGIFIVLSCLFINIFALDTDKPLTQYIRTIWTTEEGLPQNSAFSIVQTPDGYLWFGTLAGLVRFDGISFTVFDQSNTPELSSDLINAVYVDGDGTLWTATGGAYSANAKGNSLLSYKDGKFRGYTKQDGFGGENVRGFAGSKDGGLWIATSRGLYKYSAEAGFRLYTMNDGLSSDRLWTVYEASDGNVWVGSTNGLNVLRGDRFFPIGSDGKNPNSIKSIRETSDGNLWCASQKGLVKIKDESLTVYTTKDGLPEDEISSLATDRNGNLWIGTVHGRLTRYRDGKFAENISLGDSDVWSIFEDREGNIWAGVYSRGLYRLKNGNVTTFAQSEGLLADGTWGIYEDGSGSVWVTTDIGISEIRDGKVVKSYTKKDGLLDIFTSVVFQDSKNALWIGSPNGITRFEQGKFQNFPFPHKEEHFVSLFYEDSEGVLWIGTSRGLYQFADGKFVNPELNEKSKRYSVSALKTGKNGEVWLGTNVGLIEMKNGEFTPRIAPDSESPDYIMSMSADDDGTLWLATGSRGMLRFKDGNFTRFTVKEGMSDNLLFHILDDGRGNLWFGGNKGIFKVVKQEFNDFADGKISVVNSKSFDTSDGMRNRECNSANSAWRARNGNLWFPTVKGAVEINPENIEFNSIPPPVSIGKTLSDGSEFGENAEIAPGSHNFEFHYAGLSLIAPQKVKFKYILEGYDENWIDAGDRREAFYTNLPAGNYVFKVIAANNDGVWNEQGASIKFLVLEPFWRTTWFWALCFLTLLAVVYFVYRTRIRLFEKRQAEQEMFSRRLIFSQESERKRIAGELHDSVGQLLLIIKNRAFLGLDSTENTSENSKNVTASREQLSEILSSATEAIAQTRQIAYALRPLQLERLGLTAALEEMIDNVSASTGILFDVEIIELNDFLSLDEQINLFRIVQESINNIVKHSGAKRAAVSIAREENVIEVKISDDGKGFDLSEISGNNAQRTGLGLTSIAERAKILGAAYQIKSNPGDGTEIFLVLENKKSTKENDNAD